MNQRATVLFALQKKQLARNEFWNFYRISDENEAKRLVEFWIFFCQESDV